MKGQSAIQSYPMQHRTPFCWLPWTRFSKLAKYLAHKRPYAFHFQALSPNAEIKQICFLAFLIIGAIFGMPGTSFPATPLEQTTENDDDIPYDILKDEHDALKRQSRLQGIRMRTLYGPQASWHSSFIESDDEAGSRHTLALSYPLSEFWEGAALDHLSYFSLKNGSKRAARESLNMRVGLNPGMSFRPWFALTPYFNFEDADGSGLGAEAGFNKTWQNGATLSVEAYAWRPWDEGYYTIVEDGRKHGASAAFNFPFTNNLYLIGRTFYEELELGNGAKSGPQYAGNRYAASARAYYRLFHRDDAYMNYGFRGEDLWNEFLVGSEIGFFLHADFQRYFKPDGFHAINPVPEVFAQEIGMSFQYAISPRLGLTGEGFIGRDPDRDLQFGELYGLHGSITMIVNPHMRVWAEATYLKTNTTLESSGGQETTISFGINYAF